MKLKIMSFFLASVLTAGLLTGCGGDPQESTGAAVETEAEYEEGEDFNIENTIWQDGENWLVFLPDYLLIVFDKDGNEMYEDRYEWNGVMGSTSYLEYGPYIELEDGKLIAFSSEDKPSRTYEQTDRIPGTDPADGYVLADTTWKSYIGDLFTFFADGRASLRNSNLCYSFDGTYEWDPMEQTGTLNMEDHSTVLELTTDGYLYYLDGDGEEQYAGRRRFNPVVDFFALRGQEGELKGSWYSEEAGTWLIFDGAGGVTYIDEEGSEHPLSQWTNNYFYDGSEITILTGVIVRTGQPEMAYGSMVDENTISVQGTTYIRKER